MNRVTKTLVALTGAAALRLGTAAAADQPPNIVFFFIDDLGHCDVGYRGMQDDVQTPNIDQVADEGMYFTTAYATAAVCGPSRAGLLSGRYQQEWGLDGHFHKSGLPEEKNGIPPEVRLMPEYFKALGYRTGRIGKDQGGQHMKFHALNRGCDYFFGHRGPFAYHLNDWHMTFSKGKPNLWRNKERLYDLKPDYYYTDWSGDEAAAFVDRNHDQPFFLYVAFKGVHGPMHATGEDLARFAHIPEDHPIGYRREMLAMLFAVDRAIGNVMARLDAHGIAENTIIMVSSDNGGATGDYWDRMSANWKREAGNGSLNTPFRGGKNSYEEGGLRVPFCVRWPARIPAGGKVDFPVTLLDVLPTLLHAADGQHELNDDLDGINLLPWMIDPEADPAADRYLYWRHNDTWLIRDSRWKLMKAGNAPAALYDLQDDPGEQNNRIKDHPGTAGRLHQAWLKWNAANPVPFLHNNPDREDSFWTEMGRGEL